MCVGEVAHMRVLVSIVSDFLHMRHSMFTFTHEGMYRLRGVNVYGAGFDMCPCYPVHV